MLAFCINILLMHDTRYAIGISLIMKLMKDNLNILGICEAAWSRLDLVRLSVLQQLRVLLVCKKEEDCWWSDEDGEKEDELPAVTQHVQQEAAGTTKRNIFRVGVGRARQGCPVIPNEMCRAIVRGSRADV